MIEVLWDVDPKDWATDNSGVIAKRVIDKVGENDIILLHDGDSPKYVASREETIQAVSVCVWSEYPIIV